MYAEFDSIPHTERQRGCSVENSSNEHIFIKKTGEKRAPFQQKKGQKTGEIRHFQQKNGRFQAFLLTNFLNNL